MELVKVDAVNNKVVSIEIFSRECGEVVTARRLYDELGLDSRNWKRWYEKNIINNDFLIEGEDYEGFLIERSGNKTMDFYLTIPVAKKLSMKVNTVRGEEVRDYFLECEKKAKEQFYIPKTHEEALIAYANEIKAKKQLDLENKNLKLELSESKPKVEYYDIILTSNNTMNATQIGSDYGLTPIKLNKILNEERFIRKVDGQWILYAEHMGKGYEDTQTYAIEGSKPLTVWTQKGRLKIHEILTNRGIKANSDREDCI